VAECAFFSPGPLPSLKSEEKRCLVFFFILEESSAALSDPDSFPLESFIFRSASKIESAL